MTDDTSKSESKLTEAKQFKKFSCKHYSVQLKDVKIKNPGMTDDTFKSDSLIYDTQILNHIKDAIICLKNNEEQANQAKILTHLKKKMPSNPKIINLTEGCLEACLKRAVNEGVLSVQLIFKKTDTRVYRLPAGQFTLKCHTAQGKQLTDLLQILMKSLAVLNKQNVVAGMNPDLLQDEILQTEATSSIDKICTFLILNFCFEVDDEPLQGDGKNCLENVLKECVLYLMRKNRGKIFIGIEDVDSGEECFKLNLIYIHEKLFRQKEKIEYKIDSQDLVIYSKELVNQWILGKIETVIDDEFRRVLKYDRDELGLSLLNIDDSLCNLSCSVDGQINVSLVEAIDVFVDGLDREIQREMILFAKDELNLWVVDKIKNNTEKFLNEA